MDERSHSSMGWRGPLPFLALLALGALAGTLAQAAYASEVTLRADIAPQGRVLTVGDVFDGAGQKAAITLAPAPAAGGPQRLSAAFVAAKLRAVGLNWENPERLASLEIGKSASRAASPTAPQGQRLVLARDVAPGEILTADDFMLAEGPLAPGAMSDSAPLVGQETRRALRTGQPIFARDVAAPRAVKKGDPVALVYRVGSVEIAALGRALADARVGERARAVNTQSNRVVEGLAVAQGRIDAASAQTELARLMGQTP